MLKLIYFESPRPTLLPPLSMQPSNKEVFWQDGVPFCKSSKWWNRESGSTSKIHVFANHSLHCLGWNTTLAALLPEILQRASALWRFPNFRWVSLPSKSSFILLVSCLCCIILLTYYFFTTPTHIPWLTDTERETYTYVPQLWSKRERTWVG